MATVLMIAGHGENKNGTFDTGAIGYITKGEHKYYEQDFFPAMKKYVPSGSDIVFYSAHNVYDYGDLVKLANKYGSDTIVVEMHYDSFSNDKAMGGHVIVHEDFEPDKYDLAIRDVIRKHIGVRYTHKGHNGIQGRSDLGNCNRAKAAGINYRLVELGFCTNLEDASIMMEDVDAIAKDFVRALLGKVATAVTATPSTRATLTVIKGDTLWGIADKYNVSVTNLKLWNNLKSEVIYPGQVLKLVAPSRSYTVQKNDTLSGIAVTLGLTWQELAVKNGIASPYVIYPGQVLKY